MTYLAVFRVQCEGQSILLISYSIEMPPYTIVDAVAKLR